MFKQYAGLYLVYRKTGEFLTQSGAVKSVLPLAIFPEAVRKQIEAVESFTRDAKAAAILPKQIAEVLAESCGGVVISLRKVRVYVAIVSWGALLLSAVLVALLLHFLMGR